MWFNLVLIFYWKSDVMLDLFRWDKGNRKCLLWILFKHPFIYRFTLDFVQRFLIQAKYFSQIPQNVQTSPKGYRVILPYCAFTLEFFTNTQNWQQWQYWHQRLYMRTKKSSNIMLPQWALNLGPQPFGSDAQVSEPLRIVLFGLSSNCPVFLHHFDLGLRSSS